VGTQNLLYDYLNYLDGEEPLKFVAMSIYESEDVFMSENLTVFHAIIWVYGQDCERGETTYVK